MVRNRPDFYRSWSEDQWVTHATVRCCWLKSYCLSCVRSVASSLSSSKAMFLLTEHVGQSAFWNETPAFILPDLLPPISTDLNPIDCKIWEKCSSGSSKFSSWRRWTEAALDRCLASFQAKHQRWRSWWEAQVLLRVNLCERKTVFLHLIQLQ